MRGTPNAPRPGWNPATGRAYDEDKIRRLCAPREQGGEGLNQTQAARRIGCSTQTVYLALHPEARRQKDRRRLLAYQVWSDAELKAASDYHWQRLAKHQGFLDEIESELARRRKRSQ